MTRYERFVKWVGDHTPSDETIIFGVLMWSLAFATFCFYMAAMS